LFEENTEGSLDPNSSFGSNVNVAVFDAAEMGAREFTVLCELELSESEFQSPHSYLEPFVVPRFSDTKGLPQTHGAFHVTTIGPETRVIVIQFDRANAAE